MCATRGWENATATDVRDRRPVQKPSKYRNVKKTVDGITFDSTREAHRYVELKALEHAGEIVQLQCQPRFELLVTPLNVAARLQQAAARLAGKQNPVQPVAIGAYVADFSYRHAESYALVVEDVKGVKTALYRWKKKHVEAQYGITVSEVR